MVLISTQHIVREVEGGSSPYVARKTGELFRGPKSLASIQVYALREDTAGISDSQRFGLARPFD